MAYTVLSATDGVTPYDAARDQHIQQGILDAHLRMDRLFFDMNTPASGTITGTVDLTGVTDSRAAIQSRMDYASANNYAAVYFPAGTYLISTPTDGTNGYGLVVPNGLSVLGAGSNEVNFVIGGTLTFNLFMIKTTMSSTAIATITTDWSIRAKSFTCSAGIGGIVPGDLVATRIAQNPSDPAESRQTVFATVTSGSTGTTINIDTPAIWPGTVASISAVNRKFTKVTSVAERMTIGGFHVTGASTFRHAVGTQWARLIRYIDITGTDVGSGLVNAQWIDGGYARDLYAYKCGAFSNSSKGRAVSLSNVTNFTVENLNTDYLDSYSLYTESFCKNVRVVGMRIQNRSTTRSQPGMIFCGIMCSVSISNLTVDAWDTTNVAADSVISFGAATGTDRGVCHLSDVDIYMPLPEIRQVPAWNISGYFRCMDTAGTLQSFNMNRIEVSTVSITLTDNTTKTAWLGDGLLLGYRVAVPAGVTSAGLTGFTIAKGGTSASLPWVADRAVRVNQYVGSGLYPMQSNWTNGTRIQATCAAAAGLTGVVVAVTVYTVVPDEYQTVVSEPGSSQLGRFGSGYTV